MPQPSSLSLGTVQLGMPYGSVVRSEPPNDADAFALLDAAWAGGVSSFDSAAAYGAAEDVLGRWIMDRGVKPFVATKPAKDQAADNDTVAAAIAAQDGRLGGTGIDLLLVHEPAQLTAEMARILENLSDENVIGGFGASVYTPEEANAALGIPGISGLQVPFSLADRRVEAEGVLERCEGAGVMVFARSLFLQGVLLQDPASLPDTVGSLREPVARLHALAAAAKVSVMALCHAGARARGVTSRVIGVINAGQLHANVAADKENVADDVTGKAIDLFAGVDPRQIDPRTWDA